MLVEIAKIQSDGEYLKRDLGEVRSDIKEFRNRLGDVGDRLARLEERVAHLPGKGFIIVVVTTFLVIVGGLLTIAPKLQSLVGPSSPIISNSK
jgi:hypothetical protein